VPCLTTVQSEQFTVYIKNNIIFPKFNIQFTNIEDDVNSSYLSTCRWSPKTDPGCPIYTLDSMADIAHVRVVVYDCIAN
jgi:hypothetical protein